MPDPTQNNAKILEEVKAAVGESKPLSLANRFPFASASTLNDINDYVLEEVHKLEDTYLTKLLAAIGLKDISELPAEYKTTDRTSLDAICAFVAIKLKGENGTG